MVKTKDTTGVVVAQSCIWKMVGFDFCFFLCHMSISPWIRYLIQGCLEVCFFYWSVGSTVTLQQESSLSKSCPGVFLRGVCMFFLSMCTFSPGTPASFFTPKTVQTIKCVCIFLCPFCFDVLFHWIGDVSRANLASCTMTAADMHQPWNFVGNIDNWRMFLVNVALV